VRDQGSGIRDQKRDSYGEFIPRSDRLATCDELYELTGQIRRAAVSLPSNIAEGHGRLGTAEYRQFPGIARASNFELQTQLELARRLELGSSKLIDEADGLSHEVGKMLYAILESIKN
jgi:four helix bundle protein